jgi:hypothetical protein
VSGLCRYPQESDSSPAFGCALDPDAPIPRRDFNHLIGMDQGDPATENASTHTQQQSRVALVYQGLLDEPNPLPPLLNSVAVTVRHPIGKKRMLPFTRPDAAPIPGPLVSLVESSLSDL